MFSSSRLPFHHQKKKILQGKNLHSQFQLKHGLYMKWYWEKENIKKLLNDMVLSSQGWGQLSWPWKKAFYCIWRHFVSDISRKNDFRYVTPISVSQFVSFIKFGSQVHDLKSSYGASLCLNSKALNASILMRSPMHLSSLCPFILKWQRWAKISSCRHL